MIDFIKNRWKSYFEKNGRINIATDLCFVSLAVVGIFLILTLFGVDTFFNSKVMYPPKKNMIIEVVMSDGQSNIIRTNFIKRIIFKVEE